MRVLIKHACELCFVRSCTRAKHGHATSVLGWSDPCGLLATSIWPKVGSLQPSRVFCPCPKSTVVPGATFVFSSSSVHRRGERGREPGSDHCFSCTVHPAQTPPPTESRANAQDTSRKTVAEFLGPFDVGIRAVHDDLRFSSSLCHFLSLILIKRPTEGKKGESQLHILEVCNGRHSFDAHAERTP